jgi:hypothetical protein
MSRRKDVEPIGNVVRRLMRGRIPRKARKEAKILEVWDQAVGDERKDRLVPLRLRAGVLWVGVDSPAILYEVSQFEREAVLDKLKSLLPDLGIEDVKFRLR